VLVDDLDAALGPWGAWWCRLLPPSVFYLEAALAPPPAPRREGDPPRAAGDTAPRRPRQGTRSCRCGSSAAAVSRAALHSYFWGRYAQPVTIVGARDPEPLIDGLVDAIETFACSRLADGWDAGPTLSPTGPARCG
jgi:hypothetical protein